MRPPGPSTQQRGLHLAALLCFNLIPMDHGNIIAGNLTWPLMQVIRAA